MIGATARLPDGTPYYGTLGQMSYDLDEDKVQCHLCGSFFRLVGGKHILYRHGITLEEYRNAFKLRPTVATCSRGQSERIRNRSIANNTSAYGKPSLRQPTPEARQRVARWRSLAAQRPDLLALWHPTRNGTLDPWTIGPTSSAFRPWWRCPTCGHEWQAYPRHTSCKRCGSEQTRQKLRIVARERSLAAKRPDLAAELHPTRNGELDPWTLAVNSARRLWWKCSQCGHEWQRKLDRGDRRPCPRCVPSTRMPSTNPNTSIAVLRPDLVAELHPTRNGALDPLTVSRRSSRKLWWRCPGCGHEWLQAVNHRARPEASCPACARASARPGK